MSIFEAISTVEGVAIQDTQMVMHPPFCATGATAMQTEESGCFPVAA